jgi:hypothetical protein
MQRGVGVELLSWDFSETSVLIRSTRRNIPEDTILRPLYMMGRHPGFAMNLLACPLSLTKIPCAGGHKLRETQKVT